MKGRIGLIAILCLSSFSVLALDVEDIFKQIRKGKYEDAVKSRSKLSGKISSSQDKLLFDMTESLLYNSPKYTGYDPMKAYRIYNNIAYSDYLYDKKVMDVLREQEITLDELRLQIENNLIANAKAKNTIEAYDEIINICQGCSYLADAKKMKEDFIFSNALKGASVKDIEKFLMDYPNSPKKTEAIALRDSLAFALLSPSADAYIQYITMYPNSKWVPEIKKNLENMAYEEAKKQNTVNAYAKFIGNYPENQKTVREFEENIARLQGPISWQISPKYKEIRLITDSVTSQSYFLVNDFGVWGVMSVTGVQLILPEYENVSEVNAGRLFVQKNGRWGIIDVESGRELFPFVMQTASDIRPLTKNYIAYKSGGKWGLVYQGTDIAIEPFMEGALTVFNHKILANGGIAMYHAGQLIIVDGEGKKILDEQYDEVQWRNSGDIDSRFIKTRIGKKYGIIDQYGNVLAKPEFDMLPYFDSDGVASVKNFLKEGWMDTTGNYLYFDRLSYFKDCGGTDKMIAYERDGKIGFIDKTGEKNIPLTYQQLGDCFVNGLAKVQKDGMWYYINTNGEEITKVPVNSSAKMFYTDGIILVKDGGNVNIVHLNGQSYPMSGYEYVDDESSDGFLRVKKAGRWGAVDRFGKEIIPVKYDEMSRFCNGYSIVNLAGKYGLYYNNSLVLDTQYDRFVDGGHFFDNDCNAFKNGNISDVVYIQVFQGTGNEKILIKEGKVLLKTTDEVRLVKPENGYAIVKFAEYGIFTNAKCGLIAPDGKVSVVPQYSDIVLLKNSDNLFIYTNRDKKQGILSKNGDEMTPAFADKIISFDGNLILAESNDDLICFDKNGTSLLPKGYDVSGLVIKNKKENKYGVMDHSGKIKLYPVYTKVTGVLDKSAVVEYEGKYGVIKY